MSETSSAAPVSGPAGLDPQFLGSLTADGLLAMDDGELFLEARQEEQLTFEDGRLKVAARESRAGFGFRGVAGERVGYACGDRLEEQAIRAAASAVQAVAGGHGGRENVAPAVPGPRLYGARDPIGSADRGRKPQVLGRSRA